MEALFLQFESSAPNDLQLELNLINQMNKQLLLGLQSSFYIQYIVLAYKPHVYSIKSKPEKSFPTGFDCAIDDVRIQK